MYLVTLVVILGIKVVYSLLFWKVKASGETDVIRIHLMDKIGNSYLAISSTPSSFLHCSAEINMAFAFAKSNFLARKNLPQKSHQQLYIVTRCPQSAAPGPQVDDPFDVPQ